MKKCRWIRYWHEPEATPRSLGGFSLPFGEYDDTLFPLSTFSSVRRLVLLGEPGMGKSSELLNLAETEIRDPSRRLHFNLNSIGSEERLFQRIFGSKTVREWIDGDEDLYLYLDSLDEALLNINTLAGGLADELSNLPMDRLFLRLACRSGEWVNFSVLRDALNVPGDTQAFKTLQLAPLTKEDVITAAVSEGLDGNGFLNEVVARSANPLAAKPVTLGLLLNLYKQNEGLPKSQFELYERGMLALLDEDYASHPGSRTHDRLTREQRLRVAGRIAAICVFSNRSAVWTGPDTGEQTGADIDAGSLSGFCETLQDGSMFQVDSAAVAETLKKGIFRGDGSQRIRFSHQTFAEFLAAWYVNQRRIAGRSIDLLLGTEGVHPQLYETAAWIATTDRNVYERLIEKTPTVLLRSDVVAADDDLLFRLTARLLDLFDRRQLLDSDLRGEYGRLKHPRLAEQLRPFITDTKRDWLVRRVAIDISESCALEELVPDLLRVAEDAGDSHPTRVNAAYAVLRIGNAHAKKQLSSLMYGDHSSDENLELKGVALSAAIEVGVDIKNIFDALVEPPRSFLGSYKSFLYRLPEILSPRGVVAGLDWLLMRIKERGQLSYEMHQFAGSLMERAWSFLDDEEVFARFVNTVLPFLGAARMGMMRPDRDKLALSPEDQRKRRRVLVHVLPEIKENIDWYHLSLSPRLRLDLKSDLPWIVEEIATSEAREQKEALVSLLRQGVAGTQSMWGGGADPEFLDSIGRVMYSEPSIENALSSLFAAMDPRSPAAVAAKEQHHRWQEQADQLRRQDEQPTLDPPAAERVHFCLDKFETGDVDHWWILNRELTLTDESTHYGNEFESDITKLPGWQSADEATRSRILQAAKRYVAVGDPKEEDWIRERGLMQFSAFAGYRALRLLRALERASFDALTPQQLRPWLSIIYFYPSHGNSLSEDRDERSQLVLLAYEHFPSEFKRLICIEVERETQDGGGQIDFEKFSLCWDARLKGYWRERLADPLLSLPLKKQILRKLLELGDVEAESMAGDVLERALASQDGEEMVPSMAALLIEFGRVSAWPLIWKLLNEKKHLARQILDQGFFGFGSKLLDRLTERQLAELYLWLEREYPRREDPDFSNEEMAHTVGPREEIGRWRDQVLNKLKYRGTPDAVSEMENLVTALPEHDWLSLVLVETRLRMQEVSWTPLAVDDLFDVLRISRKPGPTDVMFLAAAPSDQDKLRLDEEIRNVQQALDPHSSYFRVEVRWALRPGDLIQYLNAIRPSIIHFSGHGDVDVLALQDEGGKSAVVDRSTIIEALRSANHRTELVIFNSCSSSFFASEIAREVTAAIGMDRSISDEGASAFAKGLYGALGHGLPLSQAFEQARAELQLLGSGEADVPRLHLNPAYNAGEIRFTHL